MFSRLRRGCIAGVFHAFEEAEPEGFFVIVNTVRWGHCALCFLRNVRCDDHVRNIDKRRLRITESLTVLSWLRTQGPFSWFHSKSMLQKESVSLSLLLGEALYPGTVYWQMTPYEFRGSASRNCFDSGLLCFLAVQRRERDVRGTTWPSMGTGPFTEHRCWGCCLRRR